MQPRQLDGASILCATLERLGARHVFGMPGTQNVPLFEALRKSSLRTVVPTHELAASFMAGAYYRVCGRPGILATIPGPGFTYALTGLAEARLDSAAVIHLVGTPAGGPGRHFNLQALDQRAIAAPLVKQVLEAHAPERISETVLEAHRLALAGEPGPVLVQVSGEALARQAPFDAASLAIPPDPVAAPRPQDVTAATQMLSRARRVVLLAGQGAREAPEAVRQLAERLSAPVLTTPSARGLVPEDHALALAFDTPRGSVDLVNELLAQADVVLVLGCKLGHNGTGGFRLRLPAGRTVQVDAASEVVGATYHAALGIVASTGPFLDRLHRALDASGTQAAWSAAEIAAWRERIGAEAPPQAEPRVLDGVAGNARDFFDRLRRVLPRDAILVTDSGQHQVMARRHYNVLAPGGLLHPSDLQSMGFGLPAAIAAKLAAPERTVVTVIGDGGMAMTGLELATAVREKTPLTVIACRDGRLGQIWTQQIADYGRAHGTRALPVDFEALARATGARYNAVPGLFDAPSWTGRREVRLIELGLGRVNGERAVQAQRLAKDRIGRLLGVDTVEWLRRRLR